MTHESATRLLAPYVDGALSQAEASDMRQHLLGCRACSAEVDGLEQLNRVFDFAPAPPVTFHRFWAGIQQALPSRRQPRVPVMRGSLALAFALACPLVVATAASAFASDRILPDNPLYPVKRVGETLRLKLALGNRDQMRLRLTLAAERLGEAKSMAQAQKPKLAVASLKDFQSLLTSAKPALEHEADQNETRQQVEGLQRDLIQVEAAVTAKPDAEDAQAQTIVQDSQASLAQVEQEASAPSGAESSPPPESQDTNN